MLREVNGFLRVPTRSVVLLPECDEAAVAFELGGAILITRGKSANTITISETPEGRLVVVKARLSRMIKLGWNQLRSLIWEVLSNNVGRDDTSKS